MLVDVRQVLEMSGTDELANWFTVEEMQALLRMDEIQRTAWASNRLGDLSFPYVYPNTIEKAGLERILAGLMDFQRIEVRELILVERVGCVVYQPPWERMAIPIAFPLLRFRTYQGALGHVLRAQNRLSLDDYAESMVPLPASCEIGAEEMFRRAVGELASLIIRMSPGVLSSREVAFMILATYHLQVDRRGLRFAESLAKDASRIEILSGGWR